MNDDCCRICGVYITHGFFCRDCLDEGVEKLKAALEDICDEAELEDERDREEFITEIIERL